jgi:hypothetical protein
MGATFVGERFGASVGVNDRALLNFIAMVRARPTARLVLTTREHVYAQALDRSERLRQAGLDDLRVLLTMPSYNQMQRARILYNHLYFSDLPDAYRDELLRNEFYLRIVKHEKFNPRLIEWLSSHRRLRTVPVERYRTFVENLLRDPSEIWWHAYEQEITEAGRSVLLALRSLGGKSGGHVLRAAFSTLHSTRAALYRFSTRPEDFRSGLREVANSFIKPTGAHIFEVIDPSVLDLLNSVIRTAPDNAADIVAGAVGFDQIEEIWALAKAHSNSAVLVALAGGVQRLIPTVARLAIENRRTDLGGGTIGFHGPTYERRLTIILEMADRLDSPELAALAVPMMTRLNEEWQIDQANIIDSVGLMRALDVARHLPTTDLVDIRRQVQDAVLNQVRNGCRGDELRELLRVVDTSVRGDPAVIAILTSFARFECEHFPEELRECRSSEQFDDLIQDLEFFQSRLGVDAKRLIEQVEKEREGFQKYEEDYADHIEEEGRERYHAERSADQSVSEMFSSLRGDRD